MLRLVGSCCPSCFSEPKGSTLRNPSAVGFNPAVEDEGGRSLSEPISGALGGGTVPKVKIGGFIPNAFGEGASVFPGEAQTRGLNRCFGVSMPGTLKSRAQGSQPVGNSLLFQNVPGRARTSQPRRPPPPAAWWWALPPGISGGPTRTQRPTPRPRSTDPDRTPPPPASLDGGVPAGHGDLGGSGPFSWAMRSPKNLAPLTDPRVT